MRAIGVLPRASRSAASALAVALLAFAQVLGGCSTDGLKGPGGPDGGGGGDASGGGAHDLGGGGTGPFKLFIPQTQRSKVDILFMIDNSSAMEPMQAALVTAFLDFVTPIEDLNTRGVDPDLNIGVVTSDFGAGATGAPGCTQSGPQGGGDQGRLQGKGKRAAADCLSPIGTNFIHYISAGSGLGRNNLPQGQDLLKTFGCMAAVGSAGCGFEHPLESVYAALHNNVPDNQGTVEDPGFLRDDAVLAVLFLTNEDDASAPPDTDVFDKNKTAQYGYLDSYSRQTRFAVECGAPPAFPPYGDSNGQLAQCVPAPNSPTGAGPGRQFDVQRYVNFFTTPLIYGGVKTNPLDVVLVGIDAPDDSFQVILSNPGTMAGSPYQPCGALNELSTPPCVPVLQHSCVGVDPTFFGDPAVRLNSVIRQAKYGTIGSICEHDYRQAMAAAGALVTSVLFGPSCVTAALPLNPGTGQVIASCTVTDETLLGNGTEVDNDVPACDAGHSVKPCWTISPVDYCKSLSPNGVGLLIDRGFDGNGDAIPAPAHTTAILSCSG